MCIHKFAEPPEKIAEYEIKWWIAHNEKDKKGLFRFLALNVQALYNIPIEIAERAVQTLVLAVRAHDRRDWEEASKTAGDYYAIINAASGLNFNPEVAGKLEVGWWEIHDELESVADKSPLTSQFQQLYATIFSVDPDLLQAAAESRTMATFEHDLAEEPGMSMERAQIHWGNAENYLRDFYSELDAALNQ